jgi:hypothetical protein
MTSAMLWVSAEFARGNCSSTILCARYSILSAQCSMLDARCSVFAQVWSPSLEQQSAPNRGQARGRAGSRGQQQGAAARS